MDTREEKNRFLRELGELVGREKRDRLDKQSIYRKLSDVLLLLREPRNTLMPHFV